MTHSCLFSCNMYVQPIFILVNVSNKQITTSEKHTSSKERSRCQRRRKLYYRAVALLKDEMSGEKHEKISRSSDALLGIIQRFLSCHFSHRPLWRILSEKARSWDGQSHITPLYIFPNAQAHHFNLLLSRGSCYGALFITKPRKKLEVDLTHVRKAEKVY